MSQEAAHRRPAARPQRATTIPPAVGRTTGEPTEPQPPLFTARTDDIAGVISTRGHLDQIGAEALCRTVTALGRLGHRQVVVRLGSATMTDDARTLLADHARLLRADGVGLLVR